MDDLGVSVNVSSAVAGVSAVAFVAFVEVIDLDGERHVVRIDSNGLTAARAERILADSQTD